MRLRKSLRLGFLFVPGYLALSVAAGVFVVEGTLHPSRRPLLAIGEMQAQALAHSHDADLADVLVQAGDGARLSGWSIRPHHSNGRAVILLHGASDNRLGMIGYAKLFLSHRFIVLMPDATCARG